MAVNQNDLAVVAHDHVIESLVLQREMAHEEVETLVRQMDAVLHRNLLGEALVDSELAARIVIAARQDDMAVQPIENLDGVLRQPHDEIAQMINSIIGPHNLIPVADQLLVHVGRVFKRPVAVPDDVVVIEMRIRDDELTQRYHFLSY